MDNPPLISVSRYFSGKGVLSALLRNAKAAADALEGMLFQALLHGSWNDDVSGE